LSTKEPGEIRGCMSCGCHGKKKTTTMQAHNK